MKNLFLSISLILVSSLCPVESYPGIVTRPSTAGNRMGTTFGRMAFIQNVKKFDSAKYVYAELVYVKNYGETKLLVEGKWVTQKIRSAVMAAKYRDEALDILGNDGWELTTTITREFNAGFEIFYYLKKKIE